MPIMINRGKEMLRISPKDSKKIEYSANQGRSWIVRYSGSSNTGAFSDLMDAGKKSSEQPIRGCSTQLTMVEVGFAVNVDSMNLKQIIV